MFVMKSGMARSSVGALVACVALATGSLAATPETKKAAEKAAVKAQIETDAQHDAMMAEMAKLATPGPQHERLKGMAGKWKTVTRAWFAPGEPTVSEGVAENRLVFGGRFVAMDFKGSLMDQPFEGYGLTGYDNRKKQYTVFWVDNSSTSMMVGNGSMDEAGKKLTVVATGDGPDGKPMEYKMVTQIMDENKHVWSMYGKLQGKEQLMMEITYTRM